MKKTLTEYKSLDKIIREDLKELIGLDFPIEMTTLGGKLVGFEYETEWNEGTTEPIEKTREIEKIKDGSKVKVTETYFEHKASYIRKSLNKEQIDKIEEYIKSKLG